MIEDYKATIENNTFLDYKDVLLFDKTITNTLVISKVPYSRFKIILSNYMTLNGLYFPDRELADEMDYFTLYKLNDSGNAYKFIKTTFKDEEKKYMVIGNLCSCCDKNTPVANRRYKRNGHDKCYYCLRKEKDYATVIYPEDESRKGKKKN